MFLFPLSLYRHQVSLSEPGAPWFSRVFLPFEARKAEADGDHIDTTPTPPKSQEPKVSQGCCDGVFSTLLRTTNVPPRGELAYKS